MKYGLFQRLFLIYFLFFIPLIPSSVFAEIVVANDEYLAPNQQNASYSKEVIDSILSGDEFSKTTTREVWQFKDSEDSENELDDFNIAQDIIRVISMLFKFIVIAALIVLVFLLIYHRKKWVSFLRRKGHQKDPFTAPDILFGMDIRPESLPEDIPEKARQLWRLGKHRAALSLLYRGALMYLVQYAHLPLDQSHTEGDILAMSYQPLKQASAPLNDKLNTKSNNDNNHKVTYHYLKKLTQAWQSVAYAHRLPNEQLMEYLLLHWETEFQQPLYDYQEKLINDKLGRNQ